MKDKKLRGAMKRSESKSKKAAYDAARAEVLLPEEAGSASGGDGGGGGGRTGEKERW